MPTRGPERLTAYYFTLDKMLEGELSLFAKRCVSERCFIYRDDPRSVTIAFGEPDDALAFMNLYDGDIRDEWKVESDEFAAFAA
jgi:hypothetical protein